MLRILLVILLDIQEKIWLKELEYLIFECDKTQEVKEKTSKLEKKILGLSNFRLNIK